MKNCLTEYLKFTRLLMIYHLVNRMDENIIMSPFSIQMLLSLISDATAGTAHNEVIRALEGGSTGQRRPVRRSASGQEISEWLIYIQERMGRLPAFASSNAVCLRQDIGSSVNDKFREHLENFYNGEIISSSDPVGDVNRWAARVSRGMINKIADKSMSNVLAFMLNCVVFESKWRYIYEDVKLDFTNADSSVKKVPMMAGMAEYYLENKYFTGFLRPYEDRAFYFMGLLPKKEAIAAFRRKAQARQEAIGGLHQEMRTEKNATDREAEQKIPNRDFWTHALYETDFTRLYDSRTSSYDLITRIFRP